MCIGIENEWYFRSANRLLSDCEHSLCIISSPGGSGGEVLWLARLCVCLSVSVCPQLYLPNCMRDFYQIFVHPAYRRGSVLRRGDEMRRGRDNFGSFLHHWLFIVQHSIWNPYKNGWTDRICNSCWSAVVCNEIRFVITGPPNRPVLFCSLASVHSIVVCNTAGGPGGQAADTPRPRAPPRF